jgi:hypothetical protein
MADKPYLDRFIKVYANLPLEERKLTVMVIDNEPITWQMAKAAMEEDSELGKKIAKRLIELRII